MVKIKKAIGLISGIGRHIQHTLLIVILHFEGIGFAQERKVVFHVINGYIFPDDDGIAVLSRQKLQIDEIGDAEAVPDGSEKDSRKGVGLSGEGRKGRASLAVLPARGWR